MRVLMFGWEFPPHITGGLGTACYGMTKGLLKQGIEVLFVVPKAYGDEDQQAVRIINASDIGVNVFDKEFLELIKNLTYLEVGSNLIPYLDPEEFEKITSQSVSETSQRHHSPYSYRYEFSGKYGVNLMEEVARYAMVAAEIAAHNRFDVIHAHDWLTYYAGIAAKKVSGKPLVVHIHATEFDRTGENYNTLVYEIEKAGMTAADKVIAVSNFTRRIVIDRYGIPAGKVTTVHNAIEPVNPSAMAGAKKHVKESIVTFLGRITYQKGPEYFIEAASKVLRYYPHVRFVMAGTGDMMNRMIRRVAELNIADKFHFTGFLQGENVDRMFAMSDVFVMPSVSEPFGLVPLEAMRIDTPVIVSKQSGVSEVLKHAIKIDFWDVNKMADAIYGILKYNSISKMMIREGKTEVNKMQWESAAVKIAGVYHNVVQS